MNKQLRVPDYLELSLQNSEMIQDAAIGNFGIIGAAARDILRHDPQFPARHPDFPPAKAVGMLNNLTHGYFAVRLDILWRTIHDDLPALESKVLSLLTKPNARDGDAGTTEP